MNTSDSDKKTSPEEQTETAVPDPEKNSETGGSDEIEIIVDPSKKHPKGRKSSKKVKSRPKKPSSEEILTRLMEKNQIIVKLLPRDWRERQRKIDGLPVLDDA